MKKLPIILVFAMLLLTSGVFGAYKVEIDDNTYVSDKTYFEPVSTWDEVKARTINLEVGKIIFYEGEGGSEQINAQVMPVNTTDKTLTYTSEDESIATVDSDGFVYPQGRAGETIIDVVCGKAKAKVKISVVKGVTGVTVLPEELTLYADKPVTAQLTAEVMPEDATIKDVKWYSADEAIATVDSDGLVSPCGVGQTFIYAETVDGGFEAKCTVTVTTWEKRKEEIPVVYTDYDMTVEEMVEKQMAASPTVFTTNAFPADSGGVEQYVNPENLVKGYDKYQFMNLSTSNGIDADTLNAYLNGKGILEGMGAVFKNAAEQNGISEIYLVIHACLESGNGTSELANGIEYGDTVVYNMFGIGAVDAFPVAGGSQYAYEQGWTSVEEAIYGGAKWISDNYINNVRYKQNTLYKMRWNPEEPGIHQYATDIAWASKQAKDMSAMFEAFPTANYTFEIPTYIGQDRFEVE